jgi:predicted metalloendopeptidase
LGENLADNGGLRQAYRAYRNYVALHGEESRLPGLEDYSPEQIFFIAFANANCGVETKEGIERLIANDPHIPSYYVVTGSVSNSEEFSQHFNCPPDSPMNRANKCVIW